MNKIISLMYLSNLISTYTFMCKSNTQNSQQVKMLNNYINEFKNNDFSHSEIFIKQIIKVSNENYNTLFEKELLRDIKRLNDVQDYNDFVNNITIKDKSSLTFTTIPLIIIPNTDKTSYTNDVIIHENYINTLSPDIIQQIKNNPKKKNKSFTIIA